MIYSSFVFLSLYFNHKGFDNNIIKTYNLSLALNITIFLSLSFFYFKYTNIIDGIIKKLRYEIRKYSLESVKLLCRAVEFRDDDTGPEGAGLVDGHHVQGVSGAVRGAPAQGAEGVPRR